jgi:hypothetical protein
MIEHGRLTHPPHPDFAKENLLGKVTPPLLPYWEGGEGMGEGRLGLSFHFFHKPFLIDDHPHVPPFADFFLFVEHLG